MCDHNTDDTISDPFDPAGSVPDTLDLTERGRMGIKGILGGLNPALDGELIEPRKDDVMTISMSDLRNPAVIRILTELRKVVNSIVREMGHPPEWIRV